MIDVHSHILPGLDDGAESWDETLEMARAAADDGVTTMVATPHQLPDGRMANRAREILPAFDEAKLRIKEAGIDLELEVGGEIYLSPHIDREIHQGELLTYRAERKYALVELPSSEIPPYFEEMLFALQVQGVALILAHPERHIDVMSDVERLSEWVRRGLYLQVNARSLLGESGKSSMRAAEELVHRRLVHLLASDAHGAARRPPGLSGGLRRVTEIAGAEYAQELVLSNPRRVLNGEPLNVWEPLRPQRRSVLSRLLRRA